MVVLRFSGSDGVSPGLFFQNIVLEHRSTSNHRQGLNKSTMLNKDDLELVGPQPVPAYGHNGDSREARGPELVDLGA